MTLLKTMLLLLGEVMVGAGKVLELEARHPLLLPGAPLIRGRRAEGCGVADGDERKGEGGTSEENDDKGHCEWYGRRGGLIAKCAWLRGCLDCCAQEKGRGQR